MFNTFFGDFNHIPRVSAAFQGVLKDIRGVLDGSRDVKGFQMRCGGVPEI